jgi:hypothetical protein
MLVSYCLRDAADDHKRLSDDACNPTQVGSTYEGGDAPSSGFIGIYFLLQVCEKIAVYGMSMESSRAGEVFQYPYHYFHGYIDSQQLRAHPHHSFLVSVCSSPQPCSARKPQHNSAGGRTHLYACPSLARVGVWAGGHVHTPSRIG